MLKVLSNFASKSCQSLTHSFSDIGGLGPALTSCELPSIPYHQLEVVIIVDGGAHILVVVLKFCKRYTAILLEGVPLREELFKNLVLCQLPILELGVEGNIIDISEILEADDTVTGLVELLVCELYQRASALIQVPTDGSEELVVINLPIVVLVEILEDAFELRG